MDDAYATLAELKDRLDWTLSDAEERMAQSALIDASDLARFHGLEWSVEFAPRMVSRLVLRACARYMRNPDGFTQSRAGDETVAWNDSAGENARDVYFTRSEINLLEKLAGKGSGFGTAPVSAWGPQRKRPVGMVPVSGPAGQDSFPLFADDEEPW